MSLGQVAAWNRAKDIESEGAMNRNGDILRLVLSTLLSSVRQRRPFGQQPSHF